MGLFVSSYDHPSYIGGSTSLHIFNYGYYTHRNPYYILTYPGAYNTSDSGNTIQIWLI